MSAMIDRIVAHHERRGRQDTCGVIVWLKAQASRLDGLTGEALAAEEDAIRVGLCLHEGWDPLWSAEGIQVAAAYAEPRRGQVQLIYANDIRDAGATGRTLAANLITASRTMISPDALAVLEAHAAEPV